jgi:phosphatidylglycerol:prolipoprotein diacylglycerol transferase
VYPVLLTVGGWSLQAYGVLVAVAFLVGIVLAMREARLAGEDSQRVLDLAFYVVVAAVVGGKAAYLSGQGEALARDGWRALWGSGLSFWGGLAAAAAVAAWYLRRHRLSPARMADMAAPGVLAGLVLADLGCLAAGCEFGRPTGLPIGLVYTDPRALAPTGVRLHPTQLYAAGLSLLLLLAALAARRWARARRAGQIALLTTAGLGLGYFGIEFLRGDPRPMLVPGVLSVAQSVEFVLGVCALALWWRRAPRAAAAAPRRGTKAPAARRRSA